MIDLGRAITIALAVVGGITICIAIAAFCMNLRDLFDRVDELEEVVRKHGLAIRKVKQDATD